MNLTRDHEEKKNTTPKVVNLPGQSIMLHLLEQANHSLEHRWKSEGFSYVEICTTTVNAQTAASCSKNGEPPDRGQLLNITTIDR